MRRVLAIAFAALVLSPGVSAAEEAEAAKKAEEEAQATSARNVAAVGGAKSWFVGAEVRFAMLAVTDETPSNDRSMWYRLSGGYRPLDWLTVFGRVGLDQRFVRVDGESGVRMQDTVLGAWATHSVDLAGLGWDRKINFRHRLAFYLPTSFQSQQQDLYTAPEYLMEARLNLIDELYFGLTGIMQYRFHKYAEQAGPEGGTLPRFLVAGLALLEYSPLSSKTYGTLTIGGDFYGYEVVDYPAREQDSLTETDLPPGVDLPPEDTSGEQASDIFAVPQYGYDLYLSYVPPIEEVTLAFTIALEQGGDVLRGGEPRLFFFHRDETVVSFTLSGRY